MGITSIITTLILTTIGMYIRPMGFLEPGAPEMVFDTDGRILEGLVIVEGICAKLIFSRYINQNWGDYCKLDAAYTANHKVNIIEAEKEDPKAKAKRLKNKKQQQKQMKKKRKFANRQLRRPGVR